MKIGDKVKVQGYGATFVIKFIYQDIYETFYTIVSQEPEILFQTWLTKDKLELVR